MSLDSSYFREGTSAKDSSPENEPAYGTLFAHRQEHLQTRGQPGRRALRSFGRFAFLREFPKIPHHLVCGGERPMNPPLPDILQPLGNLAIDHPALRRSVLVVFHWLPRSEYDRCDVRCQREQVSS